MANNFPNTGSLVDGHSGSGTETANAINSTLSTQIIIKVEDVAVGALQTLTINQTRTLDRIKEIGTDGTIEIVPTSATEFTLTAHRIVFDQLRLPEAFKRGFRFINSQRLPFDILVVDFSNTSPNADIDALGHVAMTYRNCWFTSYETPYETSSYTITETATIWAETAYVSSDVDSTGIPNAGGLRGITSQTDASGVESAVNFGGKRRGALDASGLVNSVFAE